MLSYLEPIFPDLSLPRLASRPECADHPELFQLLHKDAVSSAVDSRDLFSKVKTPNVNVTGYPNELKFYHKIRSEIISEFRFHSDLVSKVDAFFTAVREKRNAPNAPLVGLHIRRTDYKEHVKRLWKGMMTSKTYFVKAMNIFRQVKS